MTLVIVGILSFSVLPKFAQQSVFAEKVFFDDVLNAIRYAQKLAQVRGCKVQFSVSANSYSLSLPANRSQCNAVSPTFSLNVYNPGTGDVSYTGSQSGVTLSSSVSSFNFDALGRASTAVTLTIAGSRTIAVVSDTGLAYDSSS